MKRLTKKVHGVWTALCRYEKSPFPIVTQEIIDRLAAYEDTDFTPEEIQIQKEAMESMGWFGKMFQRYKGDPRGPIGTLGTTLGKSLVVLNVESAKNRQPVKDVDGNTWLPMLLDEFESMADVIEHGQEWIPVEERLPKPEFKDQQRGFYLVTLSNGVVKELIYEFRHYDNMMFDVGWHDTAFPVTHWMPLPQPPKEEKKK